MNSFQSDVGETGRQGLVQKLRGRFILFGAQGQNGGVIDQIRVGILRACAGEEARCQIPEFKKATLARQMKQIPGIPGFTQTLRICSRNSSDTAHGVR